MTLGDRLKERRVMLNLSRKKLSEITYITPQALATMKMESVLRNLKY